MIEHDMSDHIPDWYKPQPYSPASVYGADVVKDIQRTLMVPESGVLDAATVAHIKGLQHVFGLPGTGVIDEATAIQIQRLRDRYAV